MIELFAYFTFVFIGLWLSIGLLHLVRVLRAFHADYRRIHHLD